LRPPFVSGAGEAEVDQFVKLAVTETDEQLAREREDHERSLRGMTEAERFLVLPELSGAVVDVSDAVSGIIESSSLMLKSGYKYVTKSVQATIQNHIDHNCAGDTGAMRWIKTGRTYANNDVCPFCGGELSAGNQDLLAAYGQLFNEAFEAHDVRIQAEIQRIKAEVARLSTVNAPSIILRLTEAATKFDEFVPGLQEDIVTLNEMLASMVDAQETVSGRLTEWDEALSPLFALKQQAPQREFEKELDEDPLQAAVAALSGQIIAANEVVLKAKARIAASKAPLAERDGVKEEQEVCSIGEKIKAIEMKRARLAQEQLCVTYTEAVGEVARLDDELRVLNVQFETDQSKYIEQYFASMNKLFSELGSKEFKIHATSSQRGDKKIYALSVRYRGKAVTGDKLAKTLSESDKRSLALALFITKANNQANKIGRILVLDDPVVSFDDNRIDVSCTLFNRLASEFGHVIVITHYMSVIRRLIDMRVDATYVETYKTADSCVLRRFDAQAESRDAHERAFEEIAKRIADGGEGGNDRLLRVFFEEHVHLVFQRQIKSEGLGVLQLSDLIDGLLEKKVISEDVARKSHEYRVMFNPDHHMTSGFNPAEWCVNSVNLLEFLYGSLHADTAA
jgi:ABC-type multidrug transport system ATPase subunit